jgi:hypothetical protein
LISGNAEGWVSVQQARLYQLVRHAGPVADRTFQIEFSDPGVLAYAFTFGERGRIPKLSQSNQGDFPMTTIRTPEAVNPHRRHFLGFAATTIAAAQFATIGSAAEQSGKVPAIKPGTDTSFAPYEAAGWALGRHHNTPTNRSRIAAIITHTSPIMT